MRRHAHFTAGVWSLAYHRGKVMARPPCGFLQPKRVRLPMQRKCAFSRYNEVEKPTEDLFAKRRNR